MQRILPGFLLAILVILSFSRNGVLRSDDTVWEDVILLSPRKVRAYNELGLRRIADGRYAAAATLFLSSLKIDPLQPSVYINLGVAYERANEFPRAVKAYEMALSMLSFNSCSALYNLGHVYYYGLHDLQQALSWSLKARDCRPDDPDVHAQLAAIYADMGDRRLADEARERYRHLQQTH